jgi:hypothetical protein
VGEVLSLTIKAPPIHQKNIRQAIIVVVKDGDAGAGGFNDVLLTALSTRNIDPNQAGLERDVFVANFRWLHSGRQGPRRRCGSAGGDSLSPYAAGSCCAEDVDKGGQKDSHLPLDPMTYHSPLEHNIEEVALGPGN